MADQDSSDSLSSCGFLSVRDKVDRDLKCSGCLLLEDPEFMFESSDGM